MIEDSRQEEKSRSQVKREFLVLKDLAIQLVASSKGQLRAMPLSADTRDALLAAKGMTRSALQRQYRFLASLLAEAGEQNVAAIRAALTGELRPRAGEVSTLNDAEHWRDKLLSDDECHLAAFVERYPECDRTHLRQLVRNAKKERDLDKPPKSARQLFRYLRELSAQQG